VSEKPPRLVVLFSGHMIDGPDRVRSRFPASIEVAAAERIGLELKRLEAGVGDLAICGGAAGGDLLFAEACVDQRVPLEMLIPFDQEAFLRASVDPSGPNWRGRFLRVAAAPGVTVSVASTPTDAAPRSRAFERNNKRMLQRSLTWGEESLRFVVLWDGRGGDGAGGTAAMVEAVRKLTDSVRVVDPMDLKAR
jgi:hypothetical protein